MNDEQRIQLNKLMTENNTEDHTEQIRELKHSRKIKRCVEQIEAIVIENPKADLKTLEFLCIEPGSFLFRNYTTIFNKLMRHQIDFHVLYQFLDKLKEVEDGKLSQQEASYDIGMLLKGIYVDPRLKDIAKEPEYMKGEEMDWMDFKKMNLPKE